MGSINPLLGRSVLIVEDEPLIALELHGALHAAGASIIAATKIEEALHLIGHAQICAAIVDVKLGGEDCSSVCVALARRSIPFMFYTGYSIAPCLTAWAAAPTVDKPAASDKIVETVTQLVQADLQRCLNKAGAAINPRPERDEQGCARVARTLGVL